LERNPTYTIHLTVDALADLDDIDDYLCTHVSVDTADYVLDQLRAAMTSLTSFPERNPVPDELQLLGVTSYRQTHFKPYRIIYKIVGHEVVVELIADGRRNMQELLAKRLLG